MHEWTYASEWYYVHRWWKEWLTWYILFIVCMNEHMQVSDITFTVDEKNDWHDIYYLLYAWMNTCKWVIIRSQLMKRMIVMIYKFLFVWKKKFRMKWYSKSDLKTKDRLKKDILKHCKKFNFTCRSVLKLRFFFLPIFNR